MTDTPQPKGMEQVALDLWRALSVENDETRMKELHKFQQCRAAVHGGVVKKLSDYR